MPEAIATTKRRFYKALESLSGPQAPLAPANSETPSISSTKRSSAAAFDEARERVRKRLRKSTSTGSLSTLNQTSSVISLPHQVGPKKIDGPTKPPPNFSPWSQEAFLARLKTFSSVSLWHPKPDPINEVQWAKRGWVCVDVNTVACRGGCGKRVVVSLDGPKAPAHSSTTTEQGDGTVDEEETEHEAAALEEALAQRYKSAIVDGHSSTCLWHQGGCKDDIYRLPVVRPSVWQPELRKRFHSLVIVRTSIKDVKRKPIEASAKIINDLPAEVLDIASPLDGACIEPFEFAMHGWRGSSDSGTDLLHCDACFQRVGLWMYQPGYRLAHDNSEEEAEEDSAVLDLVEMHRDHCPWRNPATQQATGSLEGLNACQILRRIATTAARDHRRKLDMQAHRQADIAEDETVLSESLSVLSRGEIAQQDKERESRLRKLKNLFNLKRRAPTKPPVQKVA